MIKLVASCWLHFNEPLLIAYSQQSVWAYLRKSTLQFSYKLPETQASPNDAYPKHVAISWHSLLTFLWMYSQQALPEWFLNPWYSETNSEREQRCEHLATKYPFLSYISIYVRVPEGTVSTFFGRLQRSHRLLVPKCQCLFDTSPRTIMNGNGLWSFHVAINQNHCSNPSWMESPSVLIRSTS